MMTYPDHLLARRVTGYLCLAALVLFGLTHCSSGTSADADPQDAFADALTAEQIQLADEAEKLDPPPLSDIVLASGRTVQEVLDEMATRTGGRSVSPHEQKERIIARMIQTGHHFTVRSQWQFPDEGPHRPAQNGLAYTWGGKDHTIRHAPPGPSPPGSNCAVQRYGLDCSGLVYQAARAAGLTIVQGRAIDQGNPATWNRAIPDAWKIEMKARTGNDFEAGDIIGWRNHIGIVLLNRDGGVSVIQSNGSASCSVCDRTGIDQCAHNRSTARGPNLFSLARCISIWGQPRSVLRLEVDFESPWQVGARQIVFTAAGAVLSEEAAAQVLVLKQKDQPNTPIATITIPVPLSALQAGQEYPCIVSVTRFGGAGDQYFYASNEEDGQYFTFVTLSEVKAVLGGSISGSLRGLVISDVDQGNETHDTPISATFDHIPVTTGTLPERE